MHNIGIDAGGTYIKLGVTDGNGEILYRDTRPSCHDADGMADRLAMMIREAETIYPGAKAAVSFAGFVNENGNVDANQLGLFDYPLAEKLRLQLGRTVPIENDGICALTAEAYAGSLKGYRTGLMLTLGTGIGGGILAEGKPYRGFHNRNMELGHMIVHMDGLPCSCGQKGCWENYASASALQKLFGGLDPREIICLVREGKEQDKWHKWLNELCQGIMSLCAICYPEAVVIGGGLANAGDLLLESIRDTLLKDRGWQMNFTAVRIMPARFLNDAGIIGAAMLAAKMQENVSVREE